MAKPKLDRASLAGMPDVIHETFFRYDGQTHGVRMAYIGITLLPALSPGDPDRHRLPRCTGDRAGVHGRAVVAGLALIDGVFQTRDTRIRSHDAA